MRFAFPKEPSQLPADEVQAAHYAAAIYGSIVATAIIGALYGKDVAPRDMTIEVAATMVVFWLAHTWAAIAGERIHVGHGLGTRRILTLAGEEWPMVESGFAPVIALFLAWIGVLSAANGAKLALAIGIVQLVAWGFVLGRRVYGRRLSAFAAGAGNGLLGLLLVGLEIVVTH
jgi:hypothetical protein